VLKEKCVTKETCWKSGWRDARCIYGD